MRSRFESWRDLPDGSLSQVEINEMLDELEPIGSGAQQERERWLDVARQVVHYADITADTVRAGEDLRSVIDAWSATVEMCRSTLADPEDKPYPHPFLGELS